MKKIAGVMIALVTLVLCFALSACGAKYVSHCNASSMKSKNTSNNASVSFGSFSGVYVMQLDSNGEEVFITYEATLATGNIKVYYDFNDEKQDLFQIESDGSVKDKTESFISDQIIYIIIESDGKCNEGSFSFVLEKAE
ncbi:MAG: hypothetical protein K2N74_06105 [Clostridiales bacterium]|nr:hypothetical protein [Clostridiales bacterium]